MTQPLTMRQAAAYLAEHHKLTVPHNHISALLKRRDFNVQKVLGKLYTTPRQLDQLAKTYIPYASRSNKDAGWMTVKDIMKAYGVTKRTVYERARKFKWDRQQIGRAVFYLRKDVEAPPPAPKPQPKRSKPIVYNVKGEEKRRNRASLEARMRRWKEDGVKPLVLGLGEGL